MSDKAVKVFGAFRQLFVAAKDLHSNAEISVPLPHFDSPTLYRLVEITSSLLVKQPTIVDVEPPVYVIGDINGNVVDLVRILTKTESFTNHRFIFLGSYFDNFSISEEVLALLTSLIILFPHNIFLLRSNQDILLRGGDTSIPLGNSNMNGSLQSFNSSGNSLINSNTNNGNNNVNNNSNVNMVNSMNNNINMSEIDTELYDYVREMISLCPIGATVGKNREIFCCPGGIPLDKPFVNHLLEIQRPFADILPFCHIDEPYTELKSFFTKNKLRKVLRCGEVCSKGIDKKANGRIVSIFSNTNFQGQKNRGGFVFISVDLECRGYNIPVMSTNNSNSTATLSAFNYPSHSTSALIKSLHNNNSSLNNLLNNNNNNNNNNDCDNLNDDDDNNNLNSSSQQLQLQQPQQQQRHVLKQKLLKSAAPQATNLAQQHFVIQQVQKNDPNEMYGYDNLNSNMNINTNTDPNMNQSNHPIMNVNKSASTKDKKIVFKMTVAQTSGSSSEIKKSASGVPHALKQRKIGALSRAGADMSWRRSSNMLQKQSHPSLPSYQQQQQQQQQQQLQQLQPQQQQQLSNGEDINLNYST